MTPEQRKRVFEALLGNGFRGVNDRIWKEFEELAENDLERIEPVIDAIIQEEKKSMIQ